MLKSTGLSALIDKVLEPGFKQLVQHLRYSLGSTAVVAELFSSCFGARLGQARPFSWGVLSESKKLYFALPIASGRLWQYLCNVFLIARVELIDGLLYGFN